MVTNLPFIEEVAEERRATFLSTGMCTFEDIDRAVSVFRKADCPVMLMHTVSTYPTPEKNLNLQVINTLRERYGLPVGYSGHEFLVSPSIMAAMLGAMAIERHVTLDRAMYGAIRRLRLSCPGFSTSSAPFAKFPNASVTGLNAWLPVRKKWQRSFATGDLVG